ncbi:hypothetical protein BGAL_0105g00150 [Botrytis galanthina]|uniref:Uncharacterized protein n=1 Tax=Botrytis galanthina TaxID=278940 RepID=A0A4S8R3H6_9HELO|nr:hypothetical protein BGAL_0105g00150 [Botrytis galanthina]
MDKSNQETTMPSMHTVRSIEGEKNFTKFVSLLEEVKLLIWEFAIVAVPPREIALKSYQSCFSSFLERPIYYNPEKDLVYINRLNNAKRDITYRKNPFEGTSDEDKRRITHLAFNYDNLHMERNPWLHFFTRYLVQYLGNVHVIKFLLRKSAIKDLQDNKAHGLGTMVFNTKSRDGDPIWEVFFIERNEFPPFDDVTFPKKDLRDNPDSRLPRVQLLSFEELGCAISNYNKHWLYPEKCFVCKCESDDDSELLGSSDWEDYNSTAGDDL